MSCPKASVTTRRGEKNAVLLFEMKSKYIFQHDRERQGGISAELIVPHSHSGCQGCTISGWRRVLPLWDFLPLVVQIALVGFTCVCFALVHQLSCITSWLWETGLLVDFSPLPPCLSAWFSWLLPSSFFLFLFFCMTFAEFCFFHRLLLAHCARTRTRTHGLKKKKTRY